MKEKLKGGMETIIAIIIITAFVVALIYANVVPMARETNELGKEGSAGLKDLQTKMGYTDEI